MSLYQPITIKQGRTLIVEELAKWAEPLGGEVRPMANMRHLWEEIFLLKDKPRLLVCYNGENPRGGFDQTNTLNRVDRQWIVVMIQGKGWGKDLEMVDALEEVLTRLRAMRSVSEEFPIDYKGIKPLPNVGPTQAANVFMDAYTIEFSTANDIPRIDWEEPAL